MRTTQQMSNTLPNQMPEFVRVKAARGDYASDSKMLRERDRDRAIETWLRNEVVPTAKALRQNPDRALSADEVRARLVSARAGRG